MTVGNGIEVTAAMIVKYRHIVYCCQTIDFVG